MWLKSPSQSEWNFEGKVIHTAKKEHEKVLFEKVTIQFIFHKNMNKNNYRTRKI